MLSKLLKTGAVLFLFAGVSPAHAFLSRSAISSLKVTIYGVYTTSDATCASGWVQSFLSATPTVADFVQQASLGTGSSATPINCLLLIAKNSMLTSVAAGTYTTTSSSNPDSVCNAGVTDQAQHICHSVTPVWPSVVTTDAQAAGLTLATTCASSPTGNEVIPIYMSVNAACTGQQALDGSNTLCGSGGGSGPVAFVPPETTSTAGSSAKGIKLTSIASPGGTIFFTVDPDQSMGGDGSSNCVDISPSRLFIHQ